MKTAFWIAFLFCSFSFLVSSCDHDNSPLAAAETFVLVHGAWQAAYVWDSVKAQLTRQGKNVVVVELLAHGSDTTSPLRVTMNAYRDKVLAAINSVSGKVILVGHSMGGMVISITAEAAPDKIDKLVYIGAFVPANGQSLGYLTSLDKQSHLNGNVIPDTVAATLDIVRDSVVSIFCQDAPAATQQLVLDKFRPEPAIPFGDTVTITAGNWGKVDKYYIHTTLDHAISLSFQNQMVATAGLTNVYSLETSHCPFLSKPNDVTNLLLQIANQ